ncbi:MAG TPA: hypothetical protein VFJ85_14455 [Acidimicrobiales bacterium]|nr:hypothetical protein [Acidimicrobiales bacterium]
MAPAAAAAAAATWSGTVPATRRAGRRSAPAGEGAGGRRVVCTSARGRWVTRKLAPGSHERACWRRVGVGSWRPATDRVHAADQVRSNSTSKRWTARAGRRSARTASPAATAAASVAAGTARHATRRSGQRAAANVAWRRTKWCWAQVPTTRTKAPGSPATASASAKGRSAASGRTPSPAACTSAAGDAGLST